MNRALVNPVPRLIAYMIKVKYGSHVMISSLTSFPASGTSDNAMTAAQLNRKHIPAIRIVDFQRIFLCRLIKSSFKYSNPLRLLVMEISVEIDLSLAVLAACFTTSIWFVTWTSSS